MIRLDQSALPDDQKAAGEWWRCPRCDKVACIPHDRVRPIGRHRA